MEFPVFKNVYNKPGIELLPHRSPFLFVDTLLSADEKERFLHGNAYAFYRFGALPELTPIRHMAE